MLRILFLCILCIVPYFVLPTFAACSLEGSTVKSFLSDCGAGTNGIEADDPASAGGTGGMQDKLSAITENLIQLGALLAVGALVWAGIQYTKSGGDDEKLKTAKVTAVYALIGLFLLMGAFYLVDVFISFVFNDIGGGA